MLWRQLEHEWRTAASPGDAFGPWLFTPDLDHRTRLTTGALGTDSHALPAGRASKARRCTAFGTAWPRFSSNEARSFKPKPDSVTPTRQPLCASTPMHSRSSMLRLPTQSNGTSTILPCAMPISRRPQHDPDRWTHEPTNQLRASCRDPVSFGTPNASPPTRPSGSTSANNAAVDSRIVRQSKSETWVADHFFDVKGVGAIVGVGAVAGSVRPDAHRRTRSLASRIPSVRASDQSSTAIW